MKLSNLLALTANPYLSAAIWLGGALFVLYLARGPVHRSLGAVARLIYRALRLAAAGIRAAADRMAENDRRALMAAGKLERRQVLLRDIERLQALAGRSLEDHPRSHERLAQLIGRLEAEYAASAEVPPGLPEWIPAIQSVAAIEGCGSGAVADLLREIRHSLEAHHRQAADAYREATARRHERLARMRPLWQAVERRMAGTAKAIDRLCARSEIVDRYAAEYRGVTESPAEVEALMRTGIWKQFVLSALLLAAAGGGCLLDYRLLVTAGDALVPAGAGAAGQPVVPTAALVLVAAELGLGVMLLEALGFTRIFPAVGSVADPLRRRLAWLGAGLLATLAAFAALTVYLAPRPVPGTHPLAVAGPAVLAALLPALLAFTGIALESFLASARFAGSALLRVLMGTAGLLLRLAGGLALSLAGAAATAYDVVIFPALWLETLFTALRHRPAAPAPRPAAAAGEGLSGPAES